MSGDRVVKCVDANSVAFQNSLKKIKDPALLREIRESIRGVLLLTVAEIPKRFHFHQLNGKLVASALDDGKKVPAWSFHVTHNDKYKASFTFEGESIYLRRVGLHDEIDKTP